MIEKEGPGTETRVNCLNVAYTLSRILDKGDDDMH